MKKTPLIIRFPIFVLGWLILSHCSPTQQQIEEKPNILFLAVDDMNDWAGFLSGHTGMKIHTPNIDRLAAASMIFTNAHTPAPACAPTRAAILTGVHHARSGAENVYWGDGPKWREFDALKEVPTLEQFFKKNGYKTLGAGKIYHSQAPPWTPTSQVEPANWDFYYPSPYISHPYQIRAPEEVIYPEEVDNESRPGGGANGWWTWGAIPVPDEKMADYHVADWASYQLRQQHDKPFFLAVGMWKPHDPWEVPQKYFDMYPLEDIVLPQRKKDDLEDAFDHGRRRIMKWVLDNDQWKKIIQSYAASITFSDAMVGRILDAYENAEHSDNTIVVLWSDHGMHMGEKDNIEKFTLWERSTRVPLLISAPGMSLAGTVCDQPVSLMDLYPTLVELTGFEQPSHLDGNSLLPQLKDPNTITSPVISSYKFTNQKQGAIIGHAVRSMRYRYIYYPEINFEELYDHENDPNEWDNIAYKDGNTQIIDEHRKVLLEMLPQMTWKKDIPEGYTIDNNGKVRKEDFESF
ncbi:sulfatase [uncultured Cyclobacterium sp.]|uniref:sulfatase n=1 Tax=uncultured Cyclobacterium sp. TaxID=453820 RepID=UPI0030EBAC8F|tara:strand:- start:40791 stop:42347 length:1557 start_codon:yes stop_codon:yes gene_type:complete